MKTKTQSVGQLIAEKLIKAKFILFPSDPQQAKVAALINQEVEKVYGKQEKILEGETPIANEVMNAETGLAPCPGCGDDQSVDLDSGTFLYRYFCRCGWKAPNGSFEHEAKEHWNRRAPLISSRESKPTGATEEINHCVNWKPCVVKGKNSLMGYCDIHEGIHSQTFGVGAAGRETKTDEEIAGKAVDAAIDYVAHTPTEDFFDANLHLLKPGLKNIILAALREKTAAKIT